MNVVLGVARNFKFGVQIDLVMSHVRDDKISLKRH